MAKPGDEILFEITRRAGYARIVAIDAVSAVEIVALGPAQASDGELQQLARQKLLFRLARLSSGVQSPASRPSSFGAGGQSAPSQPGGGAKKGGLIV
jgi:hypothetical protein